MKRLFHRISESISHIRITIKLMLIYVIGGLVPMVLVSLMLSSAMKTSIVDQAISEASLNAERIQDRMTEIIETAIDVSDSLYLDDQLMYLATNEYTDALSLINDLNAYDEIDKYLVLYSSIDSIRVYINNQTLMNNSPFILMTEKHRNSSWYKLAIESGGRSNFIYMYDEISRKYYLTLVRLLRDDEGRDLGVLAIHLSNIYLGRLLVSEPYDVHMSIDESYIVVSTIDSYEGKLGTDLESIKVISEEPNDKGIYRLDELDSLVIENRIENQTIDNDFYIYTVIPISNLMKNANKSSSSSLLMIVASVAISLLLVYFLAKAMVVRIHTFRSDMHKVAQGNFNVVCQVQGRDEFGELGNDLNIMIKSIQSLIHENYVVNLKQEKLKNKQREVEFKMLANQINPHFLYNSLETIRMKAILSKEREIADIVKKLAKLMRRNLSISNDTVSLGSEIELISHYLEIQRFRFGDKFTYEIDSNCDVDKIQVLPFLLQPVVENAFVHGLEGHIGLGHIRINIWKEARKIIIKIADNGSGMSLDRLEIIRKHLSEGSHNIDGSIGLVNVNQRLELYYGKDSTMEISSEINIGTTVKMVIPIIDKEVSCIE